MSIEMRSIDTVCPHGPDEVIAPPLEAIETEAGEVVIIDPDHFATEWIAADIRDVQEATR